jgi:heme a synthase
MKTSPFRDRTHPITLETRWRFRLSALTVFMTLVLIGWGAFVTSIGAGLAVPDWPTTFNSYDPFNPWPGWWTITPVLAEHGHRLAGALVGLLMIALAVWTGLKDPRRWMRILGFAMLALVIVQGVMGGLRVVWVSLDLAVVHACLAQIFFSGLVAMTLFTSRSWLQGRNVLPDSPASTTTSRVATVTAVALFLQILIGALLRHPGEGLNALLAGLHIAGAAVVTTLIFVTFAFAFRLTAHNVLLRRAAAILGVMVAFQFILGLLAYFVTLDGAGMLQPSNLQVVINTSHVIVGALLMGAATAVMLIALRRPAVEFVPASAPAAPARVHA